MAAVGFFSGRVNDALAEFEMALHLNPNFLLAQGYYGLVLSAVGRRDEGVEAVRRAQRMSPRDPFSAILIAVMGFSEFVGRNYDAAMRAARGAIRQRADYAQAYRVLVAAAAMAGEIDVARAALQELRRVQPNISLAWLASFMSYAPEAERRHFVEAFRLAGLD
jgi:tetratricopeptide (TPR) repeat protein